MWSTWLAAFVCVLCLGGCTFEVTGLPLVPAGEDLGVPVMTGGDLAVPSTADDLAGGAIDLGGGAPVDMSGAVVDLVAPPPPPDLLVPPPPSDLRGCTVVSQSFVVAPPSGWLLGGDAAFDGTAQRVRLTSASQNQSGSLFWTTPIAVTSMHARFRVFIGGGNGADGVALVLAQTSTPTTGLQPTGSGALLGYRGMTGVAVELDTYRNGMEPAAEHVALTRASDGAHVVYAAPPVTLDCDCVRTVDVWLKAGRVRVRVDDQAALDEPIAPGDFTAGGTYYLGFTAATGGRDNQHAILESLFVAGPDGCE